SSVAGTTNVQPESSLKELGFDSLMIVVLRNKVRAELDLKLTVADLYAYPDLRALADGVLELLRDALAKAGEASKGASLEARATVTQGAAIGAFAEDIAIVGLAHRFPLADYWAELASSTPATRRIPEDRFGLARIYDPDPSAPGKSYVNQAGVLAGIGDFDPAFFRLTPVEAEVMDPQQRLALEVAYEGFSDAGLDVASLKGAAVGVFLGAETPNYFEGRVLDEATLGLAALGATMSAIAGRVSYALGLMGPSMVVDTACSSSLVALQLACDSLRTGSSDVALAGGVSVMVSANELVLLSKLQALAPDGRSKTFDASADGYGRGEGVGIVVLKRLADALRDGDRIHGVVRATAVNQDGASAALSAPNVRAQEKVLASALKSAKLSPTDVQYV
ncbi:polyketide synthase, partial [bacterium]